MKITVGINNNKTIVTLPYVPADGLTIDYGSSSAENCDSVKYGQIKMLGSEPLAQVSIDGTFPINKPSWHQGTYKDPFQYVRFFRNNRRDRKPMRIVITATGGKELFNRLMSCETFSWSIDRVGNINYSLSFEQYRKVY